MTATRYISSARYKFGAHCIYHTYDMDDMVAANWHDGYQCCGAGAGLFSRCR